MDPIDITGEEKLSCGLMDYSDQQGSRETVTNPPSNNDGPVHLPATAMCPSISCVSVFPIGDPHAAVFDPLLSRVGHIDLGVSRTGRAHDPSPHTSLLPVESPCGPGKNDLAFAALQQAFVEHECFLPWLPVGRSHIELMSLESDPPGYLIILLPCRGDVV